jgi:ATP-dependent DNA helicase RecG
MKNKIQKHKIKGHPFTIVGEFLIILSKSFTFWTGAQKRVKEIRTDMVQCQMNRLLQGDVGSGKQL